MGVEPTVPTMIHLVGRVTDEVFSFLGPATSALASKGVRQVVVMLDDPGFRHVVTRFDPLVELELIPFKRGLGHRWSLILRAYRHVLGQSPVHAVHAHGFLPCVLGAVLIRSMGLRTPLYYSPHGSSSLGALRSIGVVGMRLLRLTTSGDSQVSIANTSADARTLGALTQSTVDVVESPVADAFFAVERHESRFPLIVTGGRRIDPRGAELFARLAVLLGDESLKLGFNWFGQVDVASAGRLKAANVGVFDITDETERASRMAAGWIFLAAGGRPGFPLRLAEAMAAGLPCVAVDTPYHRDLIDHGRTGLLCRDDEEVMQTIAQLIDAPALRRSLGEAARDEARHRFRDDRFREALIAAYAGPPSVPPQIENTLVDKNA